LTRHWRTSRPTSRNGDATWSAVTGSSGTKSSQWNAPSRLWWRTTCGWL